jgi:hypothetical protein
VVISEIIYKLQQLVSLVDVTYASSCSRKR